MVELTRSDVALEVTVVDGVIPDDGGIQPIKVSTSFLSSFRYNLLTLCRPLLIFHQRGIPCHHSIAR